MVHKIDPKFKKGTMVSFEGANHLQALKKTYIHAIGTEDEINYYYLIEHPKGILLCDATRDQFTGFDLTSVKFGLKYICANETEIQEVITAKTEIAASGSTATENVQAQESTVVEKQNPVQPEGPDRDANEIVSVPMPYYQLLAIMSALQTTHGMMISHKAMILLQPDMTEAVYNDQLKGNLDAQKTLQDSGI